MNSEITSNKDEVGWVCMVCCEVITDQFRYCSNLHHHIRTHSRSGDGKLFEWYAAFKAYVVCLILLKNHLKFSLFFIK